MSTSSVNLGQKQRPQSPNSTVNESALTGAGDGDARLNNEQQAINKSIQNDDESSDLKVTDKDERIKVDTDLNNHNDETDDDHQEEEEEEGGEREEEEEEGGGGGKKESEKDVDENSGNNDVSRSESKCDDNDKEISGEDVKDDCNDITDGSAPSDINQLKQLIDGLDERIGDRLSQLFTTGKLTANDLDDRAFEALKEFGSVDGALSVLNEFEESSLEHVSNKSAFLCGIMKAYRQKEKQSNKCSNTVTSSVNANSTACQGAVATSIANASSTIGDVQSNISGASQASAAPSSSSSSASNNEQSHITSQHNQTPHPGPDEAKLKTILDRTGYTLDVTSGQRKYGGPPPDWDGSMPSAGSEIFVGKIPKEIFEDELIPLFENCGKIWDLRLMVDPLTGFNRGYGFITYCNKADAFDAQQKYDSYEIRKGKCLKVNISVPNLRLFVGNIPKSKTKEEIYQEFSKLTSGLTEVIVYSSPDDRKRNRGFCFLEFDSHKSASSAKRKLSSGRTKIWGCDILVDWADPQEEPDPETMSKVKVLYARNLTAKITEEQLKELFEKFGSVERVKKIKDYAFIHFDDRDNAMLAMNELNGQDVNGIKIDVSLAKPPSDRKKKEEILRNRERRVMLMMQQKALLIGAPRNSVLQTVCFTTYPPPSVATGTVTAPPAMQPGANPVLSNILNQTGRMPGSAATTGGMGNGRSRPTTALAPPIISPTAAYGPRPLTRGYYQIMPTPPLLNHPVASTRIRNNRVASNTFQGNIITPGYGQRPIPRGYYIE